jgi:hypothetical protein
MRIEYTQNPLTSIIHLDDFDKEKLKSKILISELTDIIYDDKFRLKDKSQYFSVKMAQEALEDIENVTNEVTTQYEYYIQEASQSHIGDCTAFPATCAKCYLEDYLNINTLNCYSKSILCSVQHTFIELGADATCTQVIEYLKGVDYGIIPDNWKIRADIYYNMVEEFKKDNIDTIKYLENYRYRHLGGI